MSEEKIKTPPEAFSHSLMRLVLKLTLFFGPVGLATYSEAENQRANQIHAAMRAKEHPALSEIQRKIETLLMSPEEKLAAMKFALEEHEYHLLQGSIKSNPTEVDERYQQLWETIKAREKILQELLSNNTLTQTETQELRGSFSETYESKVQPILSNRCFDAYMDELVLLRIIPLEQVQQWKELPLEEKKVAFHQFLKKRYGTHNVPRHLM